MPHTIKGLLGLILILPLLVACSGAPKTADDRPATPGVQTDSRAEQHGILYVSEQGEKLTVIYHDEGTVVEVHLPDGRVSRLPLVNSVSGNRYSDGRETFWAYCDEGIFWIVNRRVFYGKLAR